MSKKVYMIKGFDCAHCAKKAELHLAKRPEIEECVIDFSADRLHVTYKDNPLSVEQLLNIIKEVENDPIQLEDLDSKKVCYFINGFDCASCAAKSERHLNKNENIEEAVIDFSADRLYVTYKNKELSTDELKNIIKEVENDPIEIKNLNEKKEKRSIFTKNMLLTLIRVVIGTIVMILSMTVLDKPELFWVNFALVGAALVLAIYDVTWAFIKHVIHKENPIDEKLLITICCAGAFAIAGITKETHLFMESLMVIILYQVGKIIEGIATNKSKEAIMSAVSIRVETANRVNGEKIEVVTPEELKVNDVVIVSNGEKIPVDGEVIDGNADIDTSSLTGEFVPVVSYSGLEVFAGCLIKSGSIRVKVTREYKNSAVSKIVELITNSGAKKSKADEFVTKFARFYTPIVFIVSTLVGVLGGAISGDWRSWLLLGLKMLVVACPCAIVISVPLAYFSAIGLASKNGIVVKGTNYLDKINEIKKVVTDKTGTLTKGVFEVSVVNAYNGNKEELLNNLVVAESLSNHPIGKAICRHNEAKVDANDISNFEEIAGLGVSVEYKGDLLIAGNSKLLDEYQIKYQEAKENGTVVYLAKNNNCLGYVVLSDEIKADAKEMVSSFKKAGVETILLTGDKEKNAKALSEELGIDRYHSELLPEDKLNLLEKEFDKKYATAFIGDGINDAASIREADVGFAMGAIGSDVAVESADVVIMNDNPSKVYDAYRIARTARRTAVFNIVFALTVKISIELAAVITNLCGVGEVIPMWAAVLADTGLTVALVINSLLILYRKITRKSE